MKQTIKTIAILNILFLLSPLNATGQFTFYDFNPEERSARLIGQVESYISNTRNVTVIGITNQVKQKINSSAKFKEKLELLKWFEESRHSKKATGQEALPGLKEHLLTEISQALKDKTQDFVTRLRIYDWAQEQNIPSKTKAWLDILFKDLSELSIHDKKQLSARYKKLNFKSETSPRKDILQSIFNDTSANCFEREKACKELRSMGLGSIANELASNYAEAARVRAIEEERIQAEADETRRIETAQITAKFEEKRLLELRRIEAEEAQATAEEAEHIKAKEERIQAEADETRRIETAQITAQLEQERLLEQQRIEDEEAQAAAEETKHIKAEEERIKAEELRIAAEIEASKAREIEENTSDDEWEKVGDEEEI